MEDDLEALLAFEMKKLQDHFLEELPGRKAALERCWQGVLSGGSLEDLRQQIHSLRGTGSTLGFVVLGEVAAPLERALGTEGEVERPALTALYQNLLRELESPETPKLLV